MTSPAAAQVSRYCVTDGENYFGRTHVWQDTKNTLDFDWVHVGEMAIYCTADLIRQSHYGPGALGAEYDPDGRPTGHIYKYDATGAGSYDAAFDGRDNIYRVNFVNGYLSRFNTEYQSEEVLFNVGRIVDPIGITFDGTTGHIWTSGFDTGLVEQWDLDGNLISAFVVNGGATALAWDPADDTFWLYSRALNGHQQYDRNGSLLSQYVTGTYVLGGEMQAEVNRVYVARVSGRCPGDLTIAWFGATPRSTQAIVFGRERGEFTIPENLPCGGTVLRLQTQVQLVDPPGAFSTGTQGRGGISG
jgi:hypothetical protein